MTSHKRNENLTQHIDGRPTVGNDPLLKALQRSARKIITSHVYPPIPTRDWDWCAYREGDEEATSRYGWGRTESEAIEDLTNLETSE